MEQGKLGYEAKPIRIVAVLAWVVVVAGLVAPGAYANCGINKFFRSGGGDSTENVRITPGYAGQAPGNEIGRWWDSGNAALSSNFDDNDGTCPSSEWWLALGNGNMQIQGILDSAGCLGYAGCPGLEMTVVVEDYGPAGPPGINDTAYYVGFRVDDTPADLRRYDYGRTDNGSAGTSTFPFVEFPQVNVIASSSGGGHILLSYTLADQTPHVHTAFGPGDAPLPTESVVSEWHVVTYEGHTEPGRDRADGWEVVQTIPHATGGTEQMLEIPWASVGDTYIAVGVGFNGGAAGIIDSRLIGRSIVIEVILADPDLELNQRLEPSDPRQHPSQGRPRSAGGRR